MNPDYVAALCLAGVPPGMRDRIDEITGDEFATFRTTDETIYLKYSAKHAVSALDGDIGAVLGDVYKRKVPEPAFNGELTDRSNVSRHCQDNSLSNQYWGSYVALYPDRQGQFLTIQRSPFGDINAYMTQLGPVILVSSHPQALLSVTGRTVRIDWSMIAHHLVFENLGTRRTCLDGISEIRCGETMVSDGASHAFEANWNPWTVSKSGNCGRGGDDPADLVRREIFRCTEARAGRRKPFLLDLSGGFDSSTLAAVCGRRSLPAHAINVYSLETESDERGFARAVAAHAGLDLGEYRLNPEGVDLARSDARHLPNPHARSFMQEFDRIGLDAARAGGFESFMNGGGGDAVFCHLHSSAPVADAFRNPSLAPNALRVSHDVATAAQTSVWDVLRKGVIKAVRPAAPRLGRRNTTLLSPDVRSISFTPTPPWPTVPRAVDPGMIEHVHGLYISTYNMNGFGRSTALKPLFPLLSQPLIEACLSIPSWSWVGNGANRLIARRAMDGLMPADNLWRSSKGGMGLFQKQILLRNAAQMKEMLYDGQLRRQGILDVREIEQHLGQASAFTSDEIGRLLRLCDFEAWIAAWLASGDA